MLILKRTNTFNKLLLLAVFFFVLNLHTTSVFAENTQETKTPQNPELQLHIDLVLKALQLDFYNVRCRGISVAKNFNKVNRLYITKYSITANNFIKQFIDSDVRAEKEKQEVEFKRNLNRLGGCSKAKQQGWIKEIHDQFGELYQHAEQSAWFPEEN
ncbi:MAG: hypothetical protein R3254_05400 [Thiomicrorhabdus sp.]|nr:hypothetical protein [Thiomicrorhabdus sp.]